MCQSAIRLSQVKSGGFVRRTSHVASCTHSLVLQANMVPKSVPCGGCKEVLPCSNCDRDRRRFCHQGAMRTRDQTNSLQIDSPRISNPPVANRFSVQPYKTADGLRTAEVLEITQLNGNVAHIYAPPSLRGWRCLLELFTGCQPSSQQA